ncbi:MULTISPECIES: hypothetical protein [unclassified Clostridium]|jgi:Zn finger protein HypA/HybF involved in hydrogenase expression|uniref:hypothetical protein n=1 Tax=unclassified Clostridium TaxID=2614128 RepID=UPI000297DF78|nr:MULTISPECIES: hypothetical protein [unclassified Clostridium]EKQ50299.1 MAG: hypothetical protein A370_05745 [Clostridium sp. Maddingley MBC34-26]
MTGKCIDCNLYWNISIKQNIPSGGYICPRCTAKNNKLNEKDKLHKKSSVNKNVKKLQKRI